VVTDRGQAHTLEGIVASLILLSAVIFALEMTAVTPLSASTSSQHLENQQEATARGILAAAADRGALKRAILNWNETSEQYANTSTLGYYTTDPPPNTFGTMLNRSFNQEGIAYNVRLIYHSQGDTPRTRRLVYQGVPSDNAVQATRTVTLLDDDPLYDTDGDPKSLTLSDTDANFTMPDTTSQVVYNVVRVEVIVWRI
jgi:hypothetical protein